MLFGENSKESIPVTAVSNKKCPQNSNRNSVDNLLVEISTDDASDISKLNVHSGDKGYATLPSLMATLPDDFDLYKE